MTVRLEVAPATPDPAGGGRRLADLRVAEGLGREAAVLIADGGIQAVPMRMPPGAWALLVTAADRWAASGEVVLFAGHWCEHAYPASGCDGDLVLQLALPAADEAAEAGADAVAVRLAVADHGRWMPAGTWPRLGRDWPAVVAPVAAAIMGASIAAGEADPPARRPMRVFGSRSARRVGLRDLLDAGLVAAGDELVYRRPGLGVHWTGQVTAQGMLRLDDGRVFATPSGATDALGSPNQTGWRFWRRARDGHTLLDLRTEYKSTMDGFHAAG
ncbi:hypothetical protein [Amycolatopsis nigrescens]|uniref:restriction system modified-DNA reader domain-containing protein n=1 Tax=Amycolatopsis nigrescens TaxID=381445 RepID=UPI000364AB4F|nr:hypothetical protein [Amycolatopsis nigrescens]